jgi:hypothetical protein
MYGASDGALPTYYLPSASFKVVHSFFTNHFRLSLRFPNSEHDFFKFSNFQFPQSARRLVSHHMSAAGNSKSDILKWLGKVI